MSYSHKCIKPVCGNSYKDNDPDAYYCPSCVSEKNALAKRLDKTVNTVGQQPNGIFTQYEKAQKMRGLVRAQDLMSFT